MISSVHTGHERDLLIHRILIHNIFTVGLISATEILTIPKNKILVSKKILVLRRWASETKIGVDQTS